MFYKIGLNLCKMFVSVSTLHCMCSFVILKIYFFLLSSLFSGRCLYNVIWKTYINVRSSWFYLILLFFRFSLLVFHQFNRLSLYFLFPLFFSLPLFLMQLKYNNSVWVQYSRQDFGLNKHPRGHVITQRPPLSQSPCQSRSTTQSSPHTHCQPLIEPTSKAAKPP